jgi:hypothetical protein
MNRVRKIPCIVLLIATPLLAAAAQNAPAKNPLADPALSEKAQPTNPLVLKITSVLDQVLEAQKTFADQSLRVMIQAQVADMLWSHDQPRARRLFEEILQVSDRLADQGTSAPQVGWASPYAARTEVIRLIMPHDAEWATRLVEGRGEIANDVKSRSNSQNHERTILQLQLGFYYAQNNPQRAALALRPFAENGDFYSLMILLGMIRSKDQRAADDLLILALAKARAGQPNLEDIRKFALYLFPSFGEGVLRFSSNALKRDALAPPNGGNAAVEQFLDLAFDVVTRRLDPVLTGADLVPPDALSWFDYAIAKSLVPYFDRLMPDKAPVFRARVQEALRRVPPKESPNLVLSEPGTVEELLSRADAITDPRLKATLIQRAVTLASLSDDFDRAAAIIERLGTEDGRTNARNTLRQKMDQKRSEEAWAALTKGDFDKAELLAVEIDWRSDGLLVGSLVGNLSRKDKPRAARVLDEYERRAAGIEEPSERALRSMKLAAVAVSIDPNRAFEEMRRAIEEFNHAGFVPELERYRENQGGSTSGSPAARVNIGLSGILSNSDFQSLGRADLDRAVGLTQQFQMREAAALMLLNVCRGALSTLPASAR